MHAAIKGAAERVLARCGPAAIVRIAHRDRALVLAYHNVVPDGTPAQGDRSLHLPFAEFSRQLDLLERSARVVPLEAIGERRPVASDRPRVAITFDDAYRGAVVLGAAELARRGLPATIFVAPSFIGTERAFWWDALAAPASGLADGLRRHVLEALSGHDGLAHAWADRSGQRTHALSPWMLPASLDELREAARRPGLELGSHSWSHPNLARLSASEVRQELTRARAWLRREFDLSGDVLSYPYGLTSPDARAAARELGHRVAVLADGGWIGREPRDPLVTPRFTVPAGISLDGFVLRLSGMR